MEDKKEMEEKGQEVMNNRILKLSLIDKLRSMGFTEQEIEYNFSQSDRIITEKIANKNSKN